jgi:DNA-binding CsgD family transcriptional regulator
MKGYDRKNIKEMLIREGITDRKAEAGALCALGKSAKEISREMKIKEFSAKGYISEVLDILEIKSRSKFIIYCVNKISNQLRSDLKGVQK